MDAEPLMTSETQQAIQNQDEALVPEGAYLRKADRALSVMAQWGLGREAQSALLGLERAGTRDSAGAAAMSLLSVTQAMLDRSELLGWIGQHLEGLFPKDLDLANRWMTQPNRAFEGRRPVDVAVEEGLDGLKNIKAYLTRAC